MNSYSAKKSIDRLSSPEQLDAYIRVMNPGVWLVLAATVLLLAGTSAGCPWGCTPSFPRAAAASPAASGSGWTYKNIVK